jgi:hypothetical protein
MFHQRTQTENTIWTFIPQTNMKVKHRMWECGLDSSGSRQGPGYWVWGSQSSDYEQYYLLKMEVICSSETAVDFHRTAWHCISEDSNSSAAKIFGLHTVGISWPVHIKFTQKETGCSGEIQILTSGKWRSPPPLQKECRPLYLPQTLSAHWQASAVNNLHTTALSTSRSKANHVTSLRVRTDRKL